MNILVTGGGGYIGSTLVPLLLDAGHAVCVLDRFFFGVERLPVHPRLRLVREDIRWTISEHFEGVDVVVDLAALSNDPSGELDPEVTRQINHRARVRNARLARDCGVARYVLPSSCSVYGAQAPDVIVDETSPLSPLTTYAQANAAAEEGALALAGPDFCVVVLRQATVYGYSPRMRFDLAINGMTYGAWKDGRLPVMRDGTQWRPMLHVGDAARAIAFMLDAPADRVNGEIINIGSGDNNYQIGPLAEFVAENVQRDVTVEWYGDADLRSYRVSFDRLAALGFSTKFDAADGVQEVVAALEDGRTDRTIDTITLDWYQQLSDWEARIGAMRMHGGLLAIDACEPAGGDRAGEPVR